MSKQNCFRVGRVTVYLRGRIWYLRYHEHGRRRLVRAAADRHLARQLAAQVNAQLETGAPAATSFEPVDLPELRRRWLGHHEHVLRSSLATIDRYRSATEHLLTFVRDVQPVNQVARFRTGHAEAYVRYLRDLRVAPNGHPNSVKRCLRDKGVKYALEVSRTMFAFAIKRRHLPPYAENPFTAIQVDRIPVEDAKPVTVFDTEQERQFLEACDDWQLPVFATLVLTGLRPGELTHLLLPDDLDLVGGWIIVRNKPELGWKVKTRSGRRVPLVPELRALLARSVGARRTGPLFLRRRCALTGPPVTGLLPSAELPAELQRRLAASGDTSARRQHRRVAQRLWTDLGVLPEDRLRTEFMKLTRAIGLPQVTAPKSLRHLFATRLQEANVDPLIRNQLMGHVPGGDAKGRGPLGMTAVYSHAGPETVRRQLESAVSGGPAVHVLREWLKGRGWG
jgi:integrase